MKDPKLPVTSPRGGGRFRSPVRAVTLVELLVVMGALALVLGQAVPALRQVRDASKEAGCADRLGQIAQAAHVYADEDPNEHLIPVSRADRDMEQSYTASYSFGGKSGLGFTLDGNANNSPFSGLFSMGAMHRPLNRILFKQPFGPPPFIQGRFGTSRLPDWNRDNRLELDVYHCPADAGFPGMHYDGWKQRGRSAYATFGTSYGAWTLFIGFGPGSGLSSASVYAHARSQVLNPGNTLMFSEEAARFAIRATNPALDQTGCGWPYREGAFVANGWHGTPFRFTSAYADAHVSVVKIFGYGRSVLPPVLPPLCSAQTCECIPVRAPGWQIDILPAGLAPTSKIRQSPGGEGGSSDLPDSPWNVVQ